MDKVNKRYLTKSLNVMCVTEIHVNLYNALLKLLLIQKLKKEEMTL